MSISFNATQIAEFLNVSKRTIQIKSKKQDWPFTIVASNGGKTKVFSLADLPCDVSKKIRTVLVRNPVTSKDLLTKGSAAGAFLAKKEKISKKISSDTKQQSLADIAGMQGARKERALSKVHILNAANSYQLKSSLSKVNAWDQFCTLYNQNDDSVQIYKSKLVKKLSLSSLLRWEQTLNKHGVCALAGNYGKNKGNGIIDSTPELKEYCLSLIQTYPHIKGERIFELLTAQFGHKHQIPSSSTCRDWLRTWKNDNQELFMSMFDPSAWQNKRMVAFGDKAAEALRINHIWEFDSTPADVIFTDGRYSIVGVIDVFTRRVKLVLKPTSNAESIALLIRESIVDWGLPEIARTDNGADYLSNHITTVWNSLEIHNDITNPYSGWEKPFIERFFRTFSHGVAELVQGYVGHNVVDRERISSRLTFAERLLEKREKGTARVGIEVNICAKQFEELMNSWVDNHYHHAPHKGLKNKTPFSVFSQQQQTIRRIEDERQLDILLAPVPGNGIRTITKDGISVDGATFIHAELGAYVGERVFCRWNPQDIGKIYVFHALQGHFICEAVNPEIAGQDITMAHALEAKRVQRKALTDQRKSFKSLAKVNDVSDVAQKYIDYKEQQNGGLNSFPKPSEFVSNEATQAATNALKVNKPVSYSEEEINIFEQRRKELAILESMNNPDPIYKDDHHKARCLTIQNNDASITAVQKAWLHKYRNANTQAAKMLDKLISSKTQNQK